MPVTFGSVGDIIAVCILVKDCVDALSETRGSAAEYQAVVRELYILEKALLEVGILSRTHAVTPELNNLFSSITTAIDQCRKSLEAFKAKIKPYDHDLGDGSGGGKAHKILAGTARKFLWQVRMKDDVSRFRAEVVAYSMSIDQLLAAATMHTVKAESDKVTRLLTQQDNALKSLQGRLSEVNRRVTAGNNLLLKLAKAARAEWLMQLGQDLKTLMLKIMAVNLVTYAAVDKVQKSILSIEQNMPALTRSITTERIFYLEDAIGRVSTITLDFITSWDALLAVLEVRFQGKPGMKKVLKKEYAIQNRATKKDVDVSQNWESTFLPGLWFDMDMIFQEVQEEGSNDSTGDTCPRCQTRSNQPPGLQIRCSICKQVYQRVVEINTDADTSAPATTHTIAPDAPDSFAVVPPLKERPVIHPVPPSRPAKRKRDEDPDEEPANFNRVRIKAKRRRLDKSQSDTPSSAEKRKSDDAMDIDKPNDSPKRHKSNANEGSIDEHSHSAKLYHQKNREEGNLEPYTSSTPDLEFNKAFGNKNPGLFSSPPDDTSPSKKSLQKEGEEHRPPLGRASHDAQYKSPPQYDPIIHTDPKSNPQRRASDREPAKLQRKQSKPSSYKTPRATEEDARRAGIPVGYSIKNWDPTEVPIMVLGSVFDANSLGKWIYDWTVYHHGPRTPLSEMAGELWLLLIRLAGKIKRSEAIIPKIRSKENCEMVEDFLESGERLWIRFAKLLKVCEDYMWKAAKKESGGKPASLGNNSGVEFVESMFGKDRELNKTEKLMTGMRLWSMRFDANCEEILKYPAS
ncbi:uncharacterized protein N0V89_005247 [Didymosphaeria variabile]|uniref:Ubiquitin-like domain-containing protein n=1 Tax=Didymosphaeria variabile TaxID=1932322 RepID=A0A9W8XKF6_9PLEO|nr:uncharacterized protein N0V89_005247 [Didymosphaeria variabile]KAJ4353517.1 hypothetical protein N0V89_005247 [Didymosphaeria variabile]